MGSGDRDERHLGEGVAERVEHAARLVNPDGLRPVRGVRAERDTAVLAEPDRQGVLGDDLDLGTVDGDDGGGLHVGSEDDDGADVGGHISFLCSVVFG